MNGIERQAAFYRGYLIDDRSLAPLTNALMTIVSLWALVYFMSAVVGPQSRQEMAERGAAVSSLGSDLPDRSVRSLNPDRIRGGEL